MSKILFCWDCHETLIINNSLALLKSINEIFEHKGIPRKMESQDFSKLFGRSVQDCFEFFLLPDYPGEVQVCLEEFHSLEMKYVKECISVNDHVVEVISRLCAFEHHNIVVSMCTNDDLDKFLTIAGIKELFCEHLGVDHCFYKEENISSALLKAEAVKNYLLTNKYSKTVFIGDSINDVQAGKLIGAKTYFLEHDYNKGFLDEAKSLGATIITSLKEVLQEIETTVSA